MGNTKQTLMYDNNGNVVGSITLNNETFYINYLDNKGKTRIFYIRNKKNNNKPTLADLDQKDKIGI